MSERSKEIRGMLLDSLESGRMLMQVDVLDGETESRISSRVRAIAREVGARVYIRKSHANGVVSVLVMGRL